MLAYISHGHILQRNRGWISDAGPSWIFLLLAMVSPSGVIAGLYGGGMPKILASRGTATASCQQQTHREQEPSLAGAD